MTERFVSRQIRDGDNFYTLNIWFVEDNGVTEIQYTLEPRVWYPTRRNHVPSHLHPS